MLLFVVSMFVVIAVVVVVIVAEKFEITIKAFATILV